MTFLGPAVKRCISRSMGTEIERRFRVNLERLCPNGEDGKMLPKGRYIKQAYLVSDDPSVRIRVVGYDEGPVTTYTTVAQALVTIKGKGTISRREWNLSVSPEDAVEMMGVAKCGVVEKIRTELFVYHTKWELDRFLGVHEGLWLAEVELPSEDTPFDRPPWLGEEVTADSRFNNARLAMTTDRFWAV